MAREYFCAYHSYLDSMRNLSDAECGRLFRALLQYSAGDKSINLQGRESIAFDFMAVQIDRDKQSYLEKCEKNRENGAKRTQANGSERKRTVANGSQGKGEGEEKEKEKGNLEKKKLKEKKAYGSFQNVLLSEDEVEKLKDKFWDWESRIEDMSLGIESKGYKYSSHYAAILKWAEKEKKEKKNKLEKEQHVSFLDLLEDIP